MNQVPCDGSPADTVFHNQRRDIPLFIHGSATLEQLFIHGMENGMAGAIGGITRAWEARTTEWPLCNASLLIATEDDPQTFQFENVVRRFPAHDLNRVLVAEIESALRCVEGMRFPGIVLS